jgi:hypothetical protein
VLGSRRFLLNKPRSRFICSARRNRINSSEIGRSNRLIQQEK